MRKYLNDMSISIPLVAVPILLTTAWGGFEAVERIATKHFVLAQIQEATGPVQKQLSDIRAGQLDQQLQELYRAQCNGFTSPELLQMIRNLERKYYEAAGYPYQPMPCELLVRAQS